MLVEDTSAFIEQLEVAKADRRAAKRRRRVSQARLDVLRIEWEVGLAADALRQMERLLAETDVATGSSGRALLRDRRARSLEREITATRRRLQAKRAELDVKRQRLGALEQRAARFDPARRAKLFRLHSSKHHLECSERRFARFARSQSELPILVGTARWPPLVVVPRPVLVGRQGHVGRRCPDGRSRGGSRPETTGGGNGEGACRHPRRARDGRAAVTQSAGRALRRVVPRSWALRRLWRERARRFRSDPSLRRRRLRRAAEHRASLRALQAAAGRERERAPGSPERRSRPLPTTASRAVRPSGFASPRSNLEWAHLGSNQGEIPACPSRACARQASGSIG